MLDAASPESEKNFSRPQWWQEYSGSRQACFASNFAEASTDR